MGASGTIGRSLVRRMQPELLLALVSNGAVGVKLGFFVSCLQSFRARNIELACIGDGDIARARNTAAGYMLRETQIPWLLFIDMDIVFTPEHVELLFESDEPIVGGVYHMKNGKRQPCVVGLPEAEYPSDDVKKRVSVKRIGTGFIRIHRSVFEKLTETADPYTSYDGKKQWRFFPTPIVDDELLTEDWGFCDLARDAGFSIMMDARIQLGHEGTHIY